MGRPFAVRVTPDGKRAALSVRVWDALKGLVIDDDDPATYERPFLLYGGDTSLIAFRNWHATDYIVVEKGMTQ